MYKRQQIHRSEDKEKRPKVYKRQQIVGSEDEERQDSTNYDSNGYIPLLFPLEVSNPLLNLAKEIKSLTRLINI